MLNVNTTEITIVDETRECMSREMMLTLGTLGIVSKRMHISSNSFNHLVEA